MGCFPDEERWEFWSPDAYKKLAKYLDKKNKESSKKKSKEKIKR